VRDAFSVALDIFVGAASAAMLLNLMLDLEQELYQKAIAHRVRSYGSG
jgi:hypothetical protein